LKATLFLRKDHEKIQELFEKFRTTGGPEHDGKRRLFKNIRRELSLHLMIENEVLYSELRSSSTNKDTAELIDSLIEHDRDIETLLAEIDNSESDDKQLDSKVNRLLELFTAHVDREEELFVEARRVVSEQRLEELGLDLEHRKKIATQIAA
jgi:iron-sulfur cluster repair protein YtfE (RIC family)